MQKFMILPTIIVLLGAFQAQAKTYYTADGNAGLIYFMQNDSTINAAYCEGLTNSEISTIAKNIRSGLGTGQALDSRCELLSSAGIGGQEILNNLNKIKLTMAKELGAVPKLGKAMGKIMGDEKIGQQLKELFDGLTEQQVSAIENLTATEVFDQLKLEARSPLKVVVSRQQLSQEIETFLTFGN